VIIIKSINQKQKSLFPGYIDQLILFKSEFYLYVSLVNITDSFNLMEIKILSNISPIRKTKDLVIDPVD
jgi:hypothetical protein